MDDRLPDRDIVLLGIGHTNAHVLRTWRMRPIPCVRLTCVSNHPTTTYSGMLPGVLAGQYAPERMHIDLVRLSAAAGARLILGNVCGIDRERRELLFDDRAPVAYDALSIGVGSRPRCVAGAGAPLVAIKPMQTFLDRLAARLRDAALRRAARPLRVFVVGGGAGGVEIALCIPPFLRAACAGAEYELSLVEKHDRLLDEAHQASGRRAAGELQRRGVWLQVGKAVERVDDAGLVFADGERADADVVVWATGAAAPEVLGQLDLPHDDRGFLLSTPRLTSPADARIFVVGDSGSCPQWAIAKAGVYAVRQGPVLWENLGRSLRGESLIEYRPQPGFLSLLNSGDGRAILSYKGRTAHARWCWRLKNRIDSRFMAMHQDYRPMATAAWPPGPTVDVMRCAGCGGKVGADVLARVLRRLDVTPSNAVLLGLERPDDAAIVATPGGRPVVATVDFFAAPLDDPYTVGRIAALNAASDVYAMGGRPLAALAVATIPPGSERQQEQLLYDLLAGATREFRAMQTTLAGGHTIEGPQTAIGFALLADQGLRPPRLKGNARPGDCLLLSKPLGTGVLLAAHLQARCRAEWYTPLMACMLASNAMAADAADAFDVIAMTDVTGFGLAGHLLEMLRASDRAAEIELSKIPLLSGAADLLNEGLESTLSPANRAAVAVDIETAGPADAARFQSLFDPQTSGGLLMAVPEPLVNDLLAALLERGVEAALIGRVASERRGPRLRLTS